MEYQTLIYHEQDGVGVITLNRPNALNAITGQMLGELQSCLGQVEESQSVRAVVLTGAGRAFCAGQDVQVLSRETPEELVALLRDQYPPVLLKLCSLERPVICAINGAAIGSGCNLALACDLRIASDRATLGEAFVRIGAGPDTGCCYFLPRLIGLARAAEFIYTGKIIDAREAERLGLVNQVSPPDKLMEDAMALAGQLARGPTRAIGLAKRALYQGLERDLSGVLDLETGLQSQLLATEDFREGVRAFLEKRKPTFRGR